MTLVAIIAVPTLIVSSLFLVFSCLHIRRIVKRKQSRCKTKTDEENGNSDNRTGTTAGVVNVACEDATETLSGIYETCDENTPHDIYDYAVVRPKQLGKSEMQGKPEPKLSSNTEDMYSVVEKTWQEDVVISDVVKQDKIGPIYFTLERNSRKTSGNVPIGPEEIRNNSQENEEYMDNEVPLAIKSDPVYFTLENNSIDLTNSELVLEFNGIYQASRKSEGDMENVPRKGDVISEPVYFTLETTSEEAQDLQQENYEEDDEGTGDEIYENVSSYAIQKDDRMFSTQRDTQQEIIEDDDSKGSDEYVHDGKQGDNTLNVMVQMNKLSNEQIYDDWTNETITAKLKSSSCVTNQYVKCGYEKQYNLKCDIDGIDDVEATCSDIYQNIEEVRNSVYWQEAM